NIGGRQTGEGGGGQCRELLGAQRRNAKGHWPIRVDVWSHGPGNRNCECRFGVPLLDTHTKRLTAANDCGLTATIPRLERWDGVICDNLSEWIKILLTNRRRRRSRRFSHHLAAP